jgi:hypothetical protein
MRLTLPQTPSEQLASVPIVNPAASAITAASFRDRRPLIGHPCPFPASDVARALIGQHKKRKSFVPQMDHPVGVIPA